MACKYVKDFEFSSDKGFTGSAGKTQVKGYARGGSCKKGYAKGGRVDPEVREAVHRHERNMHPNEQLTPLKKGGKVMPKPAKAAMVKQEMMETPTMRRDEMMQKRVVKGPAMVAGRDPRTALIQPMAMKKGGMCKGYAEGGKVQAKIKTVMKEFGKGELHSGKNGPVVKNPKQAVAIAYSEARKKGK